MKYIYSKKGFALAEVMLGLSILAIVFTVAADMLFSSVRTNRFVVNEFQAYQLAQEGLELARMARDSNWRRNIAWNGAVSISGKAADFSQDGYYRISLDEDHKNLIFEKLSDNDVDFERTNISLYEYKVGKNIFLSHQSNGAKAAPYKRILQITSDPANNNIVKVKSIGAWNSGSMGWQTVELVTELSDWKKGI